MEVIMQSTLVRLVLALTLAVAPSLAFAGDFIPLPEVGGKNKQIEIRFIRYTGGSSGKMIVDIRNKSPKRATFKAKGLFFVPQGDAERAPQRLGAAGPFEAKGQQLNSIKLKAGATKRLKLQVFCLDSHRSSPSSGQNFKVAQKRLPKQLQNTIESGAKGILRKAKGGAANSEIQSHVWKTRNKKWIKLEGERKSEKSSSGKRQRRMHRRYRNQIQQQNQSIQ
jgi:hypothetical protein